MEVAGVVFRQAPCFSSSTADASNSRHLHSFPTMKKPCSFGPKRQPNRKPVVALAVRDEFSDKGHLQYYSGPRMAIMEKEEIASAKKVLKKKLKLLKALSKNLSTFSDMGFGLNVDNGLDHQVKGQMISEATEVLLGQLQKLKAEKMESKMMKKEEKAKKKAARMMTECKDSSSSESSSSESDCENIVNMTQLNTKLTSIPPQEASSSSVQTLEKLENSVIQNEKVGNRVTQNAIINDISTVSVECGKKIEVCMGGKCKKSGAAMLMEIFEKAVGGEATVVGCKCMGKCKDGPNVRVGSNEEMVANALCIGVGLGDVDSIVNNFFGGNQKSCSDLVPAM